MHVDFLTILFRFTLFTLLAYKLTQLTKAYVIPFLWDQIAEEKKEHTELLEKEKLLVSTQHRFETQLIQQKKTFFDLEKNAQRWQQEILLHDKEYVTENACIATAVEGKRTIQQNNLIKAKDGAYLIPQICEQAQQKLRESLSGETGEKILQTIVQQLAQAKKTPFSKN